jgi:hypothetical protein
MILVGIVCPAMTSVIATMRLSLRASISSISGQFIVFIYKGRGASRRPLQGQWLWVIDLFVDGREEEIYVSRW